MYFKVILHISTWLEQLFELMLPPRLIKLEEIRQPFIDLVFIDITEKL